MTKNHNTETLHTPLAAQLRPKNLEGYVGQSHLLGEGKPLANMFANHRLQSLLLWGPPGSGKTSLARLMADHTQLPFFSLSAVMCSTKDIRQIRSETLSTDQGVALVFLDEIHRFNKAQQDALLPLVEEGCFILVGATTENPSFNVNKALLSRMQLYTLEPLMPEDIVILLERAVAVFDQLKVAPKLLALIARAAQGDARKAINVFELAVSQLPQQSGTLTQDQVETCMQSVGSLAMDRHGDVFYELISALHKAVRGSSPDAALYWLARMLEGGCDPLYIARRVVRMASEDIGNADPRALEIALNAWEVQERLGSPEGELAIAQAVVYLAVAAKSNAVYKAFKAARRMAKQSSHAPVPLHLRNAPTNLMSEQGYGKDYAYAHDFPEAYVPGASYFPDGLAGTEFYVPVDRGMEKKIAAKLARLKQLDENLEGVKS